MHLRDEAPQFFPLGGAAVELELERALLQHNSRSRRAIVATAIKDPLSPFPRRA